MYIYVSVLLRLHTGIQLLKSQDKIQQLEVFSNDFDGLAFFLVWRIWPPVGAAKKTRFWGISLQAKA